MVDGVPAGIMLGVVTPLFAVLNNVARKYNKQPGSYNPVYKLSRLFWAGLILLIIGYSVFLYIRLNSSVGLGSGIAGALIGLPIGFIGVVVLVATTLKKT